MGMGDREGGRGGEPRGRRRGGKVDYEDCAERNEGVDRREMFVETHMTRVWIEGRQRREKRMKDSEERTGEESELSKKSSRPEWATNNGLTLCMCACVCVCVCVCLCLQDM